MQGQGQETPRSRVDFLDALVQRALRASGNEHQAVEALKRLALLSLESGGATPAGELGGDALVRSLLLTRLIVRRGKTLRFGLPVLEQFFAGAALQDEGLPEGVLSSPAAVDRWRYPLALAIAKSGWQRSSDLLEPIVKLYPGIASWLTVEAVPGMTRQFPSFLSSSNQAGQRVHQALEAWLSALAPAAGHAIYGASPRPQLVIGHQMAGQDLITAIKGEPVKPEQLVVALPEPPDYEALNVFAGEHGSWTAGPPRTNYPAWPWHWSLEWIKKNLEPFVRRGLPAEANPLWQAERRWALARAILNQKGLRLEPVDAKAVEAGAQQFASSIRVTFGSARGGARTASGAELRALITDLQAGVGIDANGKIHAPMPVPDQLDAPAHWVMDIYSEAALVDLAIYTYQAALVIYQTLVTRWFPMLASTLGLAAMLPVTVVGTVTRDTTNGLTHAGVNYCLVPQPSSAESTVAFTFGPPPNHDDVLQLLDTAEQQLQRFHPSSAPWSSIAYHWSHFASSSDTPATDLAHRWLWEDLRRLRLVSQSVPVQWS